MPSSWRGAAALAFAGTLLARSIGEQAIEDGVRQDAQQPRDDAHLPGDDAQAGAGGYFTDGGFPAGKGWDEVGLPSVNDEHAYALEISGDSRKPA